MLIGAMPGAVKGRKQGAGSGIRVLIAMACVVLIVTGLKLASSLFIPVMMGLFIALLSMPILNWLDRHGLPRPLAVLMTVFVDLLILGGIVFLASGAFGDFREESKDYTERLRRQAEEFSGRMDDQLLRLENLWRNTGVQGGEETSPTEGDQSGQPSGESQDVEDGVFEAIRPTMTFRE